MKIKRVFYILFLMIILTACTNTQEGTIEESNSEEVVLDDNLEIKENEEIATSPDGESDNKLFDYSLINTKDLEGNSVNGNIFKGKVTLVNIWGTTCNPCIVEMPELEKINENYSNEDFQVVGIVIDTFVEVEDNISQANQIVSRTGVNYKNVIPDRALMENLLLDIQFIPTTFLLDENGELVGEMIYGARDYNFFESLINSHI